MTDRDPINLAELRAEPPLGIVLADEPGLGYVDGVVVPQETLLALIDAVEAARSIAEGIDTKIYGQGGRTWHIDADPVEQDALREALARFQNDDHAN